MRYFRETLLSVVMLIVATPCARAQSVIDPDLAAQKPAVAAKAAAASDKEWTGFYAGGSVGRASAQFTGPITFASFVSGTQTLPANTVSFDTGSVSSLLGGVQAGYGFPLGSLIGGIEAQFNRAKPAGSMTAGTLPASNNDFISADAFTASSSWNMSIRGRIGATTHHTLVYGTAGLAFTSVSMSGTFPATSGFAAAAGSDTHRLSGKTFGVGAEHKIRKNITVGAEYDHMSYGDATFNIGTVQIFRPSIGPVITEPALTTLKVTANELSVRINFRLK